MTDRTMPPNGPTPGHVANTHTHTHAAHGTLGRVPVGAVIPWRDGVDIPVGFVDVSGEPWLPADGRWVQRRAV